MKIPVTLVSIGLLFACAEAPEFDRSAVIKKPAVQEGDQTPEVQNPDIQQPAPDTDPAGPGMDQPVAEEPGPEMGMDEPTPLPPFEPCPEAPAPCLVMPLGDSITWGVSAPDLGGYKVPLIQLAWNNQKLLTFVGSNQSGPDLVQGRFFPRGNEGYSGWTIDDLGDRKGISTIIEKALTTHKPHIVTLQIGTNDMNVNIETAQAPKRLGTLLDTMAKLSPNTLVVLAQIVPSRNDELNTRVQAYNAAMKELVETRSAAGQHIKLVDMYGALSKNANYKTAYLADDLHPNNAGFEVMASVWYEAIQAHLKDDASTTPSYKACASNPCTVMPLGDSITWGSGSADYGGYRVPLFRTVLKAGQAVTFVGSGNSGPQVMVEGKAFPRANEGHSGWTIDPISGRRGLSEIIETSMKTYKPDIITLQIGTNDVNTNGDLPNAPKRLSNLIDTIHKLKPETLIVLARIVPTTNDGTNEKVKAYNAAMNEIVQTRQAQGKHILLVDMYKAMVSDAQYKTKFFKDSLHPNEAGFEVMSQVWYETLKHYLPAPTAL